jgi:hypothetical protein
VVYFELHYIAGKDSALANVGLIAITNGKLALEIELRRRLKLTIQAFIQSTLVRVEPPGTGHGLGR